MQMDGGNLVLTMLMRIMMVITIYYYISNASKIGNKQAYPSMSVCLT